MQPDVPASKPSVLTPATGIVFNRCSLLWYGMAEGRLCRNNMRDYVLVSIQPVQDWYKSICKAIKFRLNRFCNDVFIFLQ
jgi:hypothetical protein